MLERRGIEEQISVLRIVVTSEAHLVSIVDHVRTLLRSLVEQRWMELEVQQGFEYVTIINQELVGDTKVVFLSTSSVLPQSIFRYW